MRLYLDDDAVADVLIKLLTTAGHDVAKPHDQGNLGQTDPRHLIHAIKTGRVFVTYNYDDFEELHDLVKASGGTHRGILVIRRDNDSSRDLSLRGIVNAIRKLELSGQVIESECLILNQYR